MLNHWWYDTVKVTGTSKSGFDNEEKVVTNFVKYFITLKNKLYYFDLFLNVIFSLLLQFQFMSIRFKKVY